MPAADPPFDLAELGRRVAAHAPELADLPLTPVRAGGTEHHLFRLGPELALRVPQSPGHWAATLSEGRWLPWIEADLPLEVPALLHLIPPGPEGAPPMLVQRWVEGRDADSAPPADLTDTGQRLARFIEALRAIPLPPDPPQGARGGPLAPQTPPFEAALAEVRALSLADADAAAALWQAGLDAPPYDGPPVWLHGDLIPANLITREGALIGVIDFGCLSTGDPAYDLIPAWFLLDAPARADFRARLAPDPSMWTRARARVVWQSVLALPYYRDSNPVMMRLARRGLAAAMEDEA